MHSLSETVEAAAALLQSGDVIVFPTDTVYGIGCDPWNRDAIDKLYAAKERPEDKGLPILISDLDVLPRLTTQKLSEMAQALADQFWPGALTLIVPKHPSLPSNIAPGETIAVRLPDSALCRELLRLAGGAVATSSANVSGMEPALSAESAHSMLGERVAAIVDGGPSEGGTPSTIVDCTCDPPRVLRDGPIDVKAYLQRT